MDYYRVVEWMGVVVISPLTTQITKQNNKKKFLWASGKIALNSSHQPPIQPDFLIPIAYFIYTTLILAPSNGNTKQSHFFCAVVIVVDVIIFFCWAPCLKFIHFLVAPTNTQKQKKSIKEKFKNNRIFCWFIFRHSKKIITEEKETFYVMYGKLSHLIPTTLGGLEL